PRRRARRRGPLVFPVSGRLMTMNPAPGTLRASLLLNLLLAALCVALVIQNRTLKQGAVPHSPTALRQGARVGGFAFRGLDGRRATLRYDDPHKRYLLFVFSTTCPYCEESLPNLEAIVRTPHDARISPLGVSIHGEEETARFASGHHITFPVVCADSSDEFQRRYGISGVPTTILVDGSGIVRN